MLRSCRSSTAAKNSATRTRFLYKYDVQLPAFDENGGLQRIRHDEPTMFLARNHPASMRFVKKFWDWVRDARDYVRSRLG